MSVRPDPVIPETRRRRASTTEKSERILKMSRSLTLTRSVLAGTLAEATPNQLDFIERWFTAELDSRERSKRLRLLKQAGFPADKTLDGYDWTNLKMPADWGRAQLENLDFVAGCEDLVLYGPVGTGKSHLAIAIGRLACERGVPVRFFPATGLLMRLPRPAGEPARPGTREHRQGPTSHHRRVRLPAHRRGGQQAPLPDHFRFLRDKEHHLHHQHRIQRMGTRARRQEHGRRPHRPHRPPRTAHQIRGPLLPKRTRPHDQITNTTQTGSGRYRTPCGKPAAYTAEKHRSQSGRQLAKTQDRAGVTLLAARLAEGVAGIEYDDDRPDPGEYDIAFTADVGVQGGGR